MSAAVAVSIALDDATVAVITRGAFSKAGRAIGTANLATLQAAAQSCNQAAVEAQEGGLAYRQYQERALLCRRRIQLIAQTQKSAA